MGIEGGEGEDCGKCPTGKGGAKGTDHGVSSRVLWQKERSELRRTFACVGDHSAADGGTG